MPANLPPEYHAAEERYRAATSEREKMARLEELITTIPKHKGTDKLRADLRRKLSKLKSAVRSKKKVSRQESVYHIEREGVARAVVVGLPNVGKSSLVAALTHAIPGISAAPYSTWTPTPGMMQVENIQIQLIDTPPLNRQHVEPELFDLIRSSDLILLLIDLQTNPIQQFEDAMKILAEHGVQPGQMHDTSPQQRATVLPLIPVVNKTDDARADDDFEVLCELLEHKWPFVPVSAQHSRNLDPLKHAVVDALQIIRVYSKPPGKEPDPTTPFVLKRGSTVQEFAARVHRDFLKNLKTARIWGQDVYDGQPVGRDHVLHDGDVVELHI